MKTAWDTHSTAALNAAACHVLETSAFALAEPLSMDCVEEPRMPLVTRMRLSGPGRGMLTIAAPRELCVTLAADMAGADAEGFGTNEALDLLGELANMIAGRWATDALGEQVVVELSIPESVEIEADQWEEIAARSTAMWLMIDEMPFILDFVWEAS